jgi:prepilin-type N-terminal cleavage/methylation domain-containing protein
MTCAQNHRGFTLVELTIVIVMLAVLSLSVMPAMSMMDKTRRAGAVAEIGLTLRSARAHAMAMGDPAGVRFDLDAGTMQSMRLPPGGEATPMIDALGVTEPRREIGTLFPGVELDDIVLADGTSGSGTVWFGSEGALEHREEDGSYEGAATHDVTVSVADGGGVVVDHLTGHVQ